MKLSVTSIAGAEITLDVMYYYFSIDSLETVTHVNYCPDSPAGPYSQYTGDFNSFQTTYMGYLFIPVPKNAI